MKKERNKEVSLGKKLIFQEIEKEFAASSTTFFSRFDRMSVADMSELRRSLEKVSRRTLLVKHSMAKKILEKAKTSDAIRFLEGSILVTLGAKEPQVVSKALVDFAKGRESLELKGLILDGKVYEGNFVKELAKLPSRKELLTMTVVRMKSPITGFVLTLNGLIASFARVLNEVHKKRAEAVPQQA